MAGPIGAQVGSFLGKTIAGGLGREQAAKLYASAEQRVKDGPQIEPPPETGTDPEKPDATRWLANVARDTVTESGAAAALGAIGRLVGGEKGRALGRRAGTVLAKHFSWPFPATGKRKNPVETPAGHDGIEGSRESSNLPDSGNR